MSERSHHGESMVLREADQQDIAELLEVITDKIAQEGDTTGNDTTWVGFWVLDPDRMGTFDLEYRPPSSASAVDRLVDHQIKKPVSNLLASFTYTNRDYEPWVNFCTRPMEIRQVYIVKDAEKLILKQRAWYEEEFDYKAAEKLSAQEIKEARTAMEARKQEAASKLRGARRQEDNLRTNRMTNLEVGELISLIRTTRRKLYPLTDEK